MPLELVEEGRAIFCTQALRLRSRFETVPEPLRSHLVQQAHSWKEAVLPRSTPSEFNESLEELVKIPGFERFMLSRTSTELLKAAKQGSVVVLIGTEASCDAILRSEGFARPRLWWCPTGSFSFVPIHAAGEFRDGGECCSDYVVSSYAPTLRSLIDSRHSLQRIARNDMRLLLAAVPKGYIGNILPSTDEEVKVIGKWIPPSAIVPLSSSEDVDLPRDGVTMQTMLDNIPKATILHLACHGTQDTTNPLESGFIMRDKLLTISQLMSLSHPNAFLAFLSACETAKGDKNQPDQTVHLAAAMLFAGFKSIVATMWSMNDQDGPTVADAVYGQLFAGDSEYLNPNDIPYAVDAAVLKLKQAGIPPVRWAPYIHIGI
ncbi:hypothetical protein BT96DRAFT_967389 [Gymnopus androsaceus JB14]|uniref:CHAT domain-containing protein n=1 Tax=Gymnopus androsaceus JB14 TaxID=1447944 RepID=A0A6A4H4G7_9AGAR|nr:hypothetical protein BT96DRAFT_967389 [Gymnopus androsaceus JB14]